MKVPVVRLRTCQGGHLYIWGISEYKNHYTTDSKIWHLLQLFHEDLGIDFDEYHYEIDRFEHYYKEFHLYEGGKDDED